MILAIDPGPEQSAFVLYDADARRFTNPWKDHTFAKWPNADVLELVRVKAKYCRDMRLVVEMIASYGMPVGREVFETCVWIGRFIQAWNEENPNEADTLYRSIVKMHLCNSMRAKDGNVRAALLDAFGGKEKAVGKKAQPGPLYGVSGDVWAALAVAVVYADKLEHAERAA